MSGEFRQVPKLTTIFSYGSISTDDPPTQRYPIAGSYTAGLTVPLLDSTPGRDRVFRLISASYPIQLFIGVAVPIRAIIQWVALGPR